MVLVLFLMMMVLYVADEVFSDYGSGFCSGTVLVLVGCWFCLGSVLVLSWFCLGPVLVMSWFCLGSVLVLSWFCLGSVLVLVLVMVMSWCRC